MSDGSGGGLRILLVEDEPANRALVRAILSRADDPRLDAVILDEAHTIADARAAIAEHSIDIALLDVRLPDGNGLDLAAELRDAGNPARVVIVSASVLPIERSRAFASGADRFLAKPFGASDLLDVLLELAAPIRPSRAVEAQ